MGRPKKKEKNAHRTEKARARRMEGTRRRALEMLQHDHGYSENGKIVFLIFWLSKFIFSVTFFLIPRRFLLISSCCSGKTEEKLQKNYCEKRNIHAKISEIYWTMQKNVPLEIFMAIHNFLYDLQTFLAVNFELAPFPCKGASLNFKENFPKF